MKHARSDYDVIQDTSAGVKLAQYIRSLPDGTFQDSHVYELANAVIDPYTPQRIPEDEPVFLIHGQDAVGAATVRI